MAVDSLDSAPAATDLGRLAADLAEVVRTAEAGADPSRGAAYLAALHVRQGVPANLRRLEKSLIAKPEFTDALTNLRKSLSELRGYLVQEPAPFGHALAPLYDGELESLVAGQLARSRIAVFVRDRRRDMSMTLQQVADKIDATASFVSQLEFGRTLPTEPRARLIDMALNLEPGEHQQGAHAFLTELREARWQISQQSEAIRRLLYAPSLNGESPPDGVPIAAVHALSLWRGPRGAQDIRALEVVSAEPGVREMVSALSSLPAEVQTQAVGFIQSLAQLRSTPRLSSRRFDPSAIWRSQQELIPRDQSLASLLTELRERFDPYDGAALPTREDTIIEIFAELQRRGIEGSRLVRGPVLRRTARVLVERSRMQEAEGRAAQISLPLSPSSMREWLLQHQTQPPEVASRRLWSYWASLEPTEALLLPTPTVSEAPTPVVDDIVEWFWVYCTEGNLRRWPHAVLEFESRRRRSLERIPTPWSLALELWVPDPTSVERELHRRSRGSLRRALEPEVTPESVAGSLLSSAYHEFFAGRLAEAQSLVRAVVERYPLVAGGHNNLGFLLLVDGRYEDALRHLQRASQLEFDEREVLDFNLACCRYALGDFTDALEGFAACLAKPLASDAVLCVIADQTLSALTLKSAADYVALCALNAGWSAVRGETRTRALDFLEIARSGRQTMSKDPQGFERRSAQEIFSESFERLQQRLASA